MALTLTIVNETSLPDGGPLSVTVTGKRGIDIGRDQHLDWTLPDPTRVISGRHCEIRYRDGAYWLHDVSTNGTFLNGSDRRMQGPHRLRHGDRLDIGHYIIAVTLDGEEAAQTPAAAATPAPYAAPEGLWAPAGQVAPPASPKDFRPPQQLKPVRPDFLDWAVDTPPDAGPWPALDPVPPPSPAPRRPPPGAEEDMAWAKAAPVPPAPPEPPLPTPRRPASPGEATGHPWTATDAEPALPRFDPLPDIPSPSQGPDRSAELARPAAHARAEAAAPDASEILRRFAKGAGLPEDYLADQDPRELAEELGALMRLVVTDLKQLLAARAESKRMARSTNQTTIQALDNNPLKFSPTPEDALRIMFGPPASGYLDARRAIEQAFKDLKVHQVKTYSAMQHALRMLVEDLDPQAIEETTDTGGLGALIGSRKAKLWDTYVARWQGLTAPHDDGMVDAFMLFFAECYDRGGGGGR